SLNRFTFSVENGCGGNNTELLRFTCNNLEFNSLETTSNKESISFSDWSVGILEIRNEICGGKVSGNTLNSIINWENVYFSEVWYFRAGFYNYDILNWLRSILIIKYLQV